jgi:hypothetical protein
LAKKKKEVVKKVEEQIAQVQPKEEEAKEVNYRLDYTKEANDFRAQIEAEYDKTLARIREKYPNELLVAERQVAELSGPERLLHFNQLRELYPMAFDSDNPLLKLVFEHTDPRPFGVREFNQSLKDAAEKMYSDATARVERFKKQAAEEQNTLYKSVLLDAVQIEQETAEDERQFLEAMKHSIAESNKTYPEMIMPTALKNVDVDVMLKTITSIRQALNLEKLNWENLDYESFMTGVDINDKESIQLRKSMWDVIQQNLSVQRLAASEQASRASQHVYISESEAFSAQAPGKMVVLDEKDFKKYFPEGMGGRYVKEEFASTKQRGLLIREHAMRVINDLTKAQANKFIKSDSTTAHILFGFKGCGKSGALSQIVYWARKNDWLVVYINSGYNLINTGDYLEKSKLIPDCWDQPQIAMKFLNNMIDAHQDKLRQIPLRTKFQLGRFEGKTLFDLVEFGSALEAYAADAVVHFRRELSLVEEFPVLLAVDDYNAIYNQSVNFADPESRRYSKDMLEGRNFTLAGLFFDGHVDHGLINGAFVGALTEEHKVEQFMEDTKEHETTWVNIPPYTRKEFDTVLEHYTRSGATSAISKKSRDYIYQICSGFGREVWRITRTL